MRVVIQRVKTAAVTIDGVTKSSIGHGLLILVGIECGDVTDDIEWLSRKIVAMRIFPDNDGKMNLDIIEAGGDILIVSQFTLYAATKKGNRPSFIRAARPEEAIPIYQNFCRNLEILTSKMICTGTFGAKMEITLTNDGPVTIILDSKNKE